MSGFCFTNAKCKVIDAKLALKNAFPALIVQATLAIAAAVIAEASLSFLGLGQQPPAPSWGSMLNTAKNYVDSAPWMAMPPLKYSGL